MSLFERFNVFLERIVQIFFVEEFRGAEHGRFEAIDDRFV